MGVEDVIKNLNNDRIELETRLEQHEAGDEIIEELEIIQQALASAAVDLLVEIIRRAAAGDIEALAAVAALPETSWMRSALEKQQELC